MSAQPLAKQIAVLGIGNLLRADEGLGVHGVNALRATGRLAGHVRLIDGGVVGLELIHHIEGCDALLVIDAIDAQVPPGQIVRLEGPDVPAIFQQKLSMHQAGLSDALALLAMDDRTPARLVLWGIQPASIEWGLELSPVVQASFDELVRRVSEELGRWGGLVSGPPAPQGRGS